MSDATVRLTYVKHADIGVQTLVRVYCEGYQIGVLAFPRKVWQDVEAGGKFEAWRVLPVDRMTFAESP